MLLIKAKQTAQEKIIKNKKETSLVMAKRRGESIIVVKKWVSVFDFLIKSISSLDISVRAKDDPIVRKMIEHKR